MKDFIKMMKNKIFLKSNSRSEKYKDEEVFWIQMIQEYKDWYSGKKETLYGTPPPSENQKVNVNNLKDSAILTWFNLHQKPKYLYDLDLAADQFCGKRVLDIGAGPMPSGLAFKDCQLYCLDPLYHKYLEVGYPIHYYENVKFIHGYSEGIPIENNFFDVVISVNAIDHVDDFFKTALEIKRVSRENGLLAMHVHYHKPTNTEPLEINDKVFMDAYNWCRGLRKVKESQKKYGYTLEQDEEKYVLWRNF